MWAKRHITPKHPNFVFFHLDAFSELYNPFGRYPATHFMLPAPSASIDRIVLTSVFTHMLEDQVFDYMREFARILKPDGLVYANFFLISDETLKAAETSGHTPWARTSSTMETASTVPTRRTRAVRSDIPTRRCGG